MKIIIENASFSRLAKFTPEEAAWLSDYLRYTISDCFRMVNGAPKFIGGSRRCLLDPWDMTFPTGLLPIVVKPAKEAGYDVIIENIMPAGRQGPPQVDRTVLSMLRGYQLEAVNTAIKRKRGVIHLPTGSGKSFIALGLIAAVEGPWLFVVHRSSIVEQVKKLFIEQIGGSGGIKSSIFRLGGMENAIGTLDPDAVKDSRICTCVSFQLLRNYIRDPKYRGFIKNIRGIIVDEAHAIPAQTFFTTLSRFDSADIRIGLSATPFDRSDDRSIITVGVLGPIIYRKSIEELTSAGFLAKAYVHMIPYEQSTSGVNWHTKYKRGIVNNVRRNKEVIRAINLAVKPCIIFVKEIAQGYNLCKLLPPFAGVPFVTGGDSVTRKEQIRQETIAGKHEIVLASETWSEGIDIPNLRSVIIAGGGKSIREVLQKVGRGSRPLEGKTTFEVWDIFDVGTNTLENHAKARRKLYERLHFPITYEKPSVPLLSPIPGTRGPRFDARQEPLI